MQDHIHIDNKTDNSVYTEKARIKNSDENKIAEQKESKPLYNLENKASEENALKSVSLKEVEQTHRDNRVKYLQIRYNSDTEIEDGESLVHFEERLKGERISYNLEENLQAMKLGFGVDTEDVNQEYAKQMEKDWKPVEVHTGIPDPTKQQNGYSEEQIAQWEKEVQEALEKEKEQMLQELEKESALSDAEKNGIQLTEEEQNLPIDELKAIIEKKIADKKINYGFQ